eukprot:CAMPEP_0196780562 /NCGR_PEP_ID=MMETSP1104-20130614/8036_1 /TAXON_ID=33652 /ORGANISM="Cafeteria sp., Strain Caron Lab Isolate" /LENGTH=396 /DNA_ID=CAMNT_0042150773 /DNA_START=14 /DNA_END=1204 /DNA_ORIENTATION=+
MTLRVFAATAVLLAASVAASEYQLFLPSATPRGSLPTASVAALSPADVAMAVLEVEGAQALSLYGVPPPEMMRMPRVSMAAVVPDAAFPELSLPAMSATDLALASEEPVSAPDLADRITAGVVDAFGDDAPVACLSFEARSVCRAFSDVEVAAARGSSASSVLDLASQLAAGAEATLLDAAKQGTGMWARFAQAGQVTRVAAQDGRLSVVLNGQNGIMELNWSDKVHRALLVELAMMSNVAEAVAPALTEQRGRTVPVNVVAVFSSLMGWQERYAEGTFERDVARALVTAALQEAAAGLSTLTENQFAVHAVEAKTTLMPSAPSSTAGSATARRLLSTSSSDDGPYTYTEIAEYQVVLWTSVALVLALLSSVLALVYMDMGPDTAGLYAKFRPHQE